MNGCPPGSLSSSRRPPCARTIWSAIARPMPVPFTFSARASRAAHELPEDGPLLVLRDAGALVFDGDADERPARRHGDFTVDDSAST